MVHSLGEVFSSIYVNYFSKISHIKQFNQLVIFSEQVLNSGHNQYMPTIYLKQNLISISQSLCLLLHRHCYLISYDIILKKCNSSISKGYIDDISSPFIIRTGGYIRHSRSCSGDRISIITISRRR